MVTVNRLLVVIFDSFYFTRQIGFFNSVVIRLIGKLGQWKMVLPFEINMFLSRLCNKLTYINLRDTHMKAEPEVAQYFQVEEEKSFVDIGANIGFYTRMIAQRGNSVLAFEPSPRTYARLCENVKTLQNVEVFNFALGDENTDEKSFCVYANSPIDGFIPDDSEKCIEHVKVKVRTIDSFRLTNVGLIKIDTEGYEYPILKGAMKTLRRDKPRLIIEMHEPLWRNDNLIVSLLHQLGYADLKRKWLSSYDKYFIVAQ